MAFPSNPEKNKVYFNDTAAFIWDGEKWVSYSTAPVKPGPVLIDDLIDSEYPTDEEFLDDVGTFSERLLTTPFTTNSSVDDIEVLKRDVNGILFNPSTNSVFFNGDIYSQPAGAKLTIDNADIADELNVGNVITGTFVDAGRVDFYESFRYNRLTEFADYDPLTKEIDPATGQLSPVLNTSYEYKSTGDVIPSGSSAAGYLLYVEEFLEDCSRIEYRVTSIASDGEFVYDEFIIYPKAGLGQFDIKRSNGTTVSNPANLNDALASPEITTSPNLKLGVIAYTGNTAAIVLGTNPAAPDMAVTTQLEIISTLRPNRVQYSEVSS